MSASALLIASVSFMGGPFGSGCVRTPLYADWAAHQQAKAE